MTRTIEIIAAAAAGVLLLLGFGCTQAPVRPDVAPAARYAVDPFWPKTLPNNWIMGQVAGLAVDGRDHVWVIHRPRTLGDEEQGAALRPPRANCCVPAPSVLEFDAEGNLIQAWGGPGTHAAWPVNEHGIYVDPTGNVWIAGNDAKADHHIMKFTAGGKFLMQIGEAGKTGGSNSTTLLGRPAHMELDTAANELYVADGYGNKRVIVFDATTGAYKRHWGAYGNRPSDEKLPMYNPVSPQFASPVHCVRLSNDGLVYVCDRANDRIQVFEKNGKFVKEFRVEPETLQNGSTWDLVFSEDREQKHLIVANGANGYLLVLSRDTGEVLSTFSRPGRMAGELRWVHSLAIDSKGSLYTAEVGFGRRAQKFVRVAN